MWRPKFSLCQGLRVSRFCDHSGRTVGNQEICEGSKTCPRAYPVEKHRAGITTVLNFGSIRISYAHGLTGRIPAAAARTARGVGCLGSTAR
jgi:hypothetical protein